MMPIGRARRRGFLGHPESAKEVTGGAAKEMLPVPSITAVN